MPTTINYGPCECCGGDSSSGSGSGSGSDDPPVETVCCDNATPASLSFSVDDPSGAPLDGLSGTVVYDPESVATWKWEGTLCGWPARLWLICTEGETWVLNFGWMDNFDAPTQICIPFDYDQSISTVTCDPFLATSDGSPLTLPGTCPCGVGVDADPIFTFSE